MPSVMPLIFSLWLKKMPQPITKHKAKMECAMPVPINKFVNQLIRLQIISTQRYKNYCKFPNLYAKNLQIQDFFCNFAFSFITIDVFKLFDT